MLGRVLLFFLLGSLLSFAAGRAHAADVSARPILFVHGFNPLGVGEDCRHDFEVMEEALTQKGFTGPKITIGYYSDDRNCDIFTSPHGNVRSHIAELSKDFAWYVYNEFSSHHVSVDVVSHSMGALMIRYALVRSANHDPSFPPYLLVAHSLTMAGPFMGYSLLAEACHVNFLNVQCDEMFPYSGFIKNLKKSKPEVPEGRDGTVWSNIASNADFIEQSDGFVGSASATSMKIPVADKLILPWHMFVFHTGYTHNKAVIARVARDLGAVEIATPVALPDESSGAVNAEIPRAELERDFSKLPPSQQPAKVKANLENGEPEGVLFTNVLPDGVFSKMGIESGDVVRGCREDNVNDPFEAMDDFEASRSPIVMSFCILRQGRVLSRKIRIL